MILGLYGSPDLLLLFLAGEPDITYVLFDIFEALEEAELEVTVVCWLDGPAMVGWMAEREV